jgi:hypothetical protein
MLSPVQVLAVYIFICDIFGELCVVALVVVVDGVGLLALLVDGGMS